MKQKPLPRPDAIRVLAFDLDGTILKPQAILGDRTRDVFRACADQGRALIVCTGRSPASAEPYRAALCAGTAPVWPLVAFNGVLVTVPATGEVLYQALLSREIALAGLAIARSLGVYYQAFVPGPGVPEPVFTSRAGRRMPCAPLEALLRADRADGAAAETYRQHSGIAPVPGGLEEALTTGDGCFKAMFIAPPERQAQIRRAVQERFGDAVAVVRTRVDFVELLHPAASKGQGLMRALAYLGQTPAQTLAFGDEENDLSLLSTAGWGIAPANACPEVQAIADHITGPNTCEGIAAFLESWLQGAP